MINYRMINHSIIMINYMIENNEWINCHHM